MNAIGWIMLVFSLLGAADRIFGNRLGLGKAFERGFEMMGPLALSMLGMIVIAPFLAQCMLPFLNRLPSFIDPSILTGALFANDMGGASLAAEVARDPTLGLFNGLVVGATMGCTVSFTVPYAMSAVEKEERGDVLLGLLCGIVTIPLGCFVGGLTTGIGIGALAVDLLPLVLFSALIAVGLLFAPNLCVKLFTWLGYLIKALITVGLCIGMVHLLTGYTPVEPITPLTEAGEIVLTAAVVMTGAFPLLWIVLAMILFLFRKTHGDEKKGAISQVSLLGFISTLATSVTTFGDIKKMDRRGRIVNSAFAVSAAFLLTDHLAFTMTFHEPFLPAVLIAKAAGGITAVAVAWALSRKAKNEPATNG